MTSLSLLVASIVLQFFASWGQDISEAICILDHFSGQCDRRGIINTALILKERKKILWTDALWTEAMCNEGQKAHHHMAEDPSKGNQ